MAAKYPRKRQTFAYESYHYGRQLRRLFLSSLWRWLITAALVASIYGVLWHYSSKSAIVKSKKRKFNAIIAGLSIALGLNIASSLKAMVGQLRWWALSLREWSPREADLILQSENISHLLKLLWVSNRFWIHLYVVFWVMINVASQVAIATLGLTYNINTADRVAITRPGTVAIPELSNIQTNKVLVSKSQALNALRYTANSYGNVALAYGSENMDSLPAPSTFYNPDNPLLFCANISCQYVFFEATPESLSYYIMVATNRSVTASGRCESWRVIDGGDGSRETITIDDDEQTVIEIPVAYGTAQSTFMVDPETDSGPTWSRITAFEASATDPWYYVCNVTIDPVTNAVLPQHKLGVNITTLAAPAIALQGYGSSPLSVNVTAGTQFQSYPAESYYGAPYSGSSSDMGLAMAQFAAGVVAVTAQANTNILAPGLLPLRGIQLDIASWTNIHLILGLTVGLQLLLAVLSVLMAGRVLVRDHSPMSMATLLRPVVQGLSYRAAMANESQIASLFEPGTRVRYVASGGGYAVEVSGRRLSVG